MQRVYDRYRPKYDAGATAVLAASFLAFLFLFVEYVVGYQDFRHLYGPGRAWYY